MKHVVTLAGLVLASSISLFGQAFTGSLNGIVRDPADTVVPNATVRLRNEATQETRQVISAADGRFNFSQLLPGIYEVSAEAPGFKRSVQPGVQVRVNQTLELDVKLQLGEVTQTVQVTEGVTMLDTQTANRSITLDQQTVLDLPVNARNPFVLVHVNAGVIAVRTGISQATQDQNHNRFSMNGGRGQAGLTLIDGVPAAAGDWGGLIASPSVDSVQEVNIARNQYDAQFGKSDGSAVNMITRGGGQDFHGAAFEFLRNDNLDANSWGNNRARLRRVEFQRNQFGGTFSGPIWRQKKLFFFTAYEGLRQGSPGTNISSLPTPLQRTGDFSETFINTATRTTVYNPFSTRPNPAGAGFVRDPFPANRVPQSQFDPVAVNVLKILPQPNTAGDAIINTRNFAATGKTVTMNDRFDARIDWSRSERHTLYGRITKAWQENVAPKFFGNGLDTNFSDVNPRHQIIIGNTFVWNPTFVTNILIGSGRWRENQVSPSQGMNAAQVYGLPQSLVSQFIAQTLPAISMQGYASLANRRWLNVPRETHNLQFNNTKELGRHSLKFGFIAEAIKLNNTDFNTAAFNFDRGLTSGPTLTTAFANTTTGDGFASFLLGTGAGGDTPIRAATAATNMYYGAYIQDGWRVNSRLTLHLGLRYELQQARNERFNRVNYFDFDLTSPLAQRTGLPLKGGLVFGDANRRGAWQTDKLDLAPRVGLAYKVTDKLVLRGGYGIFYPPTVGGGVGNDGFSTTTAWVSTVGGDAINPGNLLRNPFPNGVNLPAGASRGALTLAGESVAAWQWHHPSGYVQSFSFDAQYEFGHGAILEVGYTGTQSRKLQFGAGRNANQLHPQFLAQGAALTQNVDNPFFGVLTGVLGTRQVQRQRLLRPFPQFQNVNLNENTPGATAGFNALVVRFNKTISSSLNLLATYQWSRATDNASEWQGWEVADTLRNYYDLKSDHSTSAHDIPQSFVTALVYDLPVGRGKKHGASMPAVANAVIGGWQVSGIVRFSHGLPLDFRANNTLGNFGFNVQRPNVTNEKEASISGRTPDRWFNTAAFSQPGQFDIGNAPRWLRHVRFGATQHADLALLKNFSALERIKIQFRAEFFNITNTPQFGRANTTLGSADFGRVTGTTNVGPRNTQLGLRLQF